MHVCFCLCVCEREMKTVQIQRSGFHKLCVKIIAPLFWAPEFQPCFDLASNFEFFLDFLDFDMQLIENLVEDTAEKQKRCDHFEAEYIS